MVVFRSIESRFSKGMEFDGIAVLEILPGDSSVTVLIVVHEKLLDIIDVGLVDHTQPVKDALEALDQFFEVQGAVSVVVVPVEDLVDGDLDVLGEDGPGMLVVEVQGDHIGEIFPAESAVPVLVVVVHEVIDVSLANLVRDAESSVDALEGLLDLVSLQLPVIVLVELGEEVGDRHSDVFGESLVLH